MSRKSFEEIQSFINKSIISLIERNDSFATWLDSDQFQLNVTISYTHLPHYKQIGPTCGLTALLMIKDYYNKHQTDTISNTEEEKEKQTILNKMNNPSEFSERLSNLLNIAIKKKFTNKGEMFWSKGMALLLKNCCGLKCKVIRFQNNPSNNNKYLTQQFENMKINHSTKNINYDIKNGKNTIQKNQFNNN
ncbi:hypothetical protein PIROE2DRAFT_12534 [Piromyces sp. E2]|nr:hypothetical protein PIROE2DRAFT_12534 [Piromyces sp. E2]|eukprot:OUM61483.1 hypothetical protein PIROE2DRAFT_12534 [Piromyces sp. E2]